MADDAAPDQQCMDENGGGGGGLAEVVGPMKGMLVKQTARGCLQECMGCEAKSEFQISDFDPSMTDGVFLVEGAMDKKNEMYALEKSSCLCRLCWRDGRPFDMPVTVGGEEGGAQLVNFKKPCGCPVVQTIQLNENSVEIPCCCMLPEVTAVQPDGRETSRTKYQCDLCLYVPKLMYQEQTNGVWEDIYKIRPETCCAGCCIMVKCSGKGCCSVPFLLWDAKSGEKVQTEFDGDGEAAITKLWAGLKKECCTTADNFAITFPKECTPERKIGLLGSTFLLDFTVFERQQQG